MENKGIWLNLIFPAVSGAITWVATRWYERRKFKAETDTVVVGNDRSEIENYKLLVAEWRETAQKWKDLADEYQGKLIENTKKIDELYLRNSEVRRELSSVKGLLTKANNRIKELENNAK